jgi:hypothetical protein
MGAIMALVILLSVVLVPAASAGGYPGGCQPLYHRVRVGETLTTIAWRYGTSVWYLANINHIPNINRIYAGQVLLIRPCYYAPKPPRPPAPPPCPQPCPPPPPPPCPQPCPPPASTSWTAWYFNNRDLQGAPVWQQSFSNLAFNWGFGSPNLQFVQPDNFSARFQRTVASEGCTYRIQVWSDDGVRVFLDGNQIIDGWKVQALTGYSVDLFIPYGQHTLTVEYFEETQRAEINLQVKKL